jgi:hypothetical protein
LHVDLSKEENGHKEAQKAQKKTKRNVFRRQTRRPRTSVF